MIYFKRLGQTKAKVTHLSSVLEDFPGIELAVPHNEVYGGHQEVDIGEAVVRCSSRSVYFGLKCKPQGMDIKCSLRIIPVLRYGATVLMNINEVFDSFREGARRWGDFQIGETFLKLQVVKRYLLFALADSELKLRGTHCVLPHREYLSDEVFGKEEKPAIEAEAEAADKTKVCNTISLTLILVCS
jgi:hypothetical protein